MPSTTITPFKLEVVVVARVTGPLSVLVDVVVPIIEPTVKAELVEVSLVPSNQVFPKENEILLVPPKLIGDGETALTTEAPAPMRRPANAAIPM